MISKAEAQLGYKLPGAYIALLKNRNGGYPVDFCYPTETPTPFADDHIEITRIQGIGVDDGIDSKYSGSQYMIKEWGYPDIGIVFCECPSVGHDAVMLDYRACGNEGEPQVIHVDVESSDAPVITFLAKDFESFIRGLVNYDVYDNSKKWLQKTLEKIQTAKFSKTLDKICEGQNAVPAIESQIRKICTDLTKAKGNFNLHGDELSYLMYDIQFWLFEKTFGVKSLQEYLKKYPNILAMSGDFSTGGYGEMFVKDWFKARTEGGCIQESDGMIRFTSDYEKSLIDRVNSY